jgi:hypothetical protein
VWETQNIIKYVNLLSKSCCCSCCWSWCCAAICERLVPPASEDSSACCNWAWRGDTAHITHYSLLVIICGHASTRRGSCHKPPYSLPHTLLTFGWAFCDDCRVACSKLWRASLVCCCCWMGVDWAELVGGARGGVVNDFEDSIGSISSKILLEAC